MEINPRPQRPRVDELMADVTFDDGTVVTLRGMALVEFLRQLREGGWVVDHHRE